MRNLVYRTSEVISSLPAVKLANEYPGYYSMPNLIWECDRGLSRLGETKEKKKMEGETVLFVLMLFPKGLR